MADRKNQGSGKKSLNNNGKIHPPAVFNRSLTVNSSSAAAEAALSIPLYNVYTTTSAFQRNGSVKGSYYGCSAANSFSGKVRKLCSIFESTKHHQISQSLPSPTSLKSHHNLPSTTNHPTGNAKNPPPPSTIRLPDTEDRVVIYFTSLRGIRRTFQDCHSTRLIFRGFRVNLDERDISMDTAYRQELEKLLCHHNTPIALPQVFIKGNHIGGADVIKHMLEAGELAKVIKGLPLRPMMSCNACDDIRFMPCPNCDGSRKVFDEYDEQPMRCPDCNENGLVRCPLCCT